MRGTRRILLLLLAAGALLLPAPPARPEPSGEWSRVYGPLLPGGEPLDAEGYRTIVAVRVLGDAAGGLVPVADARVSAWSEEVGPGALGARKLGEGITDDHGFANVTWSDEEFHPFHWVVEADGWALWHDAGIGGEVVLEPATTRRFRVLDPLGEPLAGARMEWFHGCPHAPALRVVRIDETGIVVLDGVAEEPGGELWIVAPGVDPGPYDFPAAAVGDIDEPPALLTDPGRTASGIVVGPDGAPRPGMVVREIGYPRGPVTTTDARGRFVLHGIEDGALGVFRPDAAYEERPSAAVMDFEEDVPLQIVLAGDRPRAPGEGEVRHSLDVLVLQRWSADGDTSAKSGVPVSLARLSDGYTVRGTTGRVTRGLLVIQVPPGEYRVVAGGGLSDVTRGETTVRVPRPDASPVRFVLDRQPCLHVRGELPRKVGFVLRVPGASRAMNFVQFPPLPAEGPAVLVVYGLRPRVLPVGPIEDAARTVTLPPALGPREPSHVRVRVRSEDAEVSPEEILLEWVEGEWGLEPERADDGTWIARSRHVGRAVLKATADGHQPEWRVVALPATPGEIDLPEIVLRRTGERTFRIVDAAGKPVTEVDPERAPRDGWGNELLDEEARFTVEVGPRPESWVVATPRHVTPRPTENWYPLRIALDLASPPEIRFPGGRITVEVRDESGFDLPAVGYVDLERIDGHGTLDLRGVPAGPHLLFVGAPDCFGEVRRIVLREGEHRRIELTLRPRR